jgi:TolB-like protein/DNA-binding winged helix-turn-helix (wHTH) protein/tetratricopeptide (TPR) repeat protein
MSLETNPVFLFGPFRLDPAERLLTRDQKPIHLPPKAFDSLVVLVENRGHLLEKEELFNRVWPGTFVEESNLAQCISVLRKALRDGEGSLQYIETVPRRGYRFVAEVHEIEPNGSGPEANLVTSEVTQQFGTNKPAQPIRPNIPTMNSVRRSVLIAGGLIGLFAILLSISAFRNRAGKRAAGTIHSLAVLPLQNLSSDPGQEYLADGMTEALITDLAKIRGLQVISRTSAMQYKDSRKRLPQIAQELGVEAVIEGAVLRSGDRVRVSAQLIRANTDKGLWADSYERDVRDLVGLEGEVARDIATQIRTEITTRQDSRLVSSAAVDPQAHEDYLKGRYFWNRRTKTAYLKSIEHFNHAISVAPDYAQAYAGLADAYALLGSLPDDPEIRRDVYMSKAKEAALTALHLDESLAEAHTSLAFVEMHYDWNFAEAEREFRRAIDLNPNYATAHQWYALDLVALGRLDEAVSEIKRARQVDPLSLIINTDSAEILFYARRYEEALNQIHITLEMDPSFPLAHSVLERIYDEKGMYREAIAEGERTVAMTGTDRWMISDLAYTYAVAGKRAELKRCLAKLPKSAGGSDPLDGTSAEVFAALGETDRAFQALKVRFQKRDGGLMLLNVEPEFSNLKFDRRFQDLSRRVGLPQ